MIIYLCGKCSTGGKERSHRLASKVGLSHWDYRITVTDPKKEDRE
jgi:hypothetical protein